MINCNKLKKILLIIYFSDNKIIQCQNRIDKILII